MAGEKKKAGDNKSKNGTGVVANRSSIVAVDSSKAEEEPEADVDQTSLLDVVIEEYNLEKDTRTSRILVTGLIKDKNNSGDVKTLHTNYMAQVSKDTITGACFIINDSAIAHILEASSESITEYLRLLKSDAETNVLTDVQICSVSEEIPREYNVWAMRSITLEDSGFEKGDMDWLEVMFGMLKQFLELGRECKQMGNTKAQQFLEMGADKKNLHARIPTVSQVKALQKCAELFSVDDWLEVFDVPVEFTLEGEKVWPVDPPLRY